jgi:hypothetical protein
MSLYDAFNAIEAVLWAVVAVVIWCRAPTPTRQQRLSVHLALAAFLAFGATDLLEIGSQGRLPMWLWGCKIGCGVAILIARYMWRGWATFRWRDREMTFAARCLIAVVGVVALQRLIG